MQIVVYIVYAVKRNLVHN